MSTLSDAYHAKQKKVLSNLVKQIAEAGEDNNVAVVSYGGKAVVKFHFSLILNKYDIKGAFIG